MARDLLGLHTLPFIVLKIWTVCSYLFVSSWGFLCSLDQANLELTKSRLPLLQECWN